MVSQRGEEDEHAGALCVTTLHFLPMLICISDSVFIYIFIDIYIHTYCVCMYVLCARTLNLAAGWNQGIRAAAASSPSGCQIGQTLTQTSLSRTLL